jgi:endonuclease/exonuclease/phosphatase family metal-dependent hydrolase
MMMGGGRKRYALSWAKNVLFGINLLAIAALLLSYLAPFINPHSFAFPSLLGLFYPVLFIVNLLFLLWWIFRRKWLFLFPLLALLLGWNVFVKHFAFGMDTQPSPEDEGFKVASYNVRIFDVHNWRPGEQALTRDSILTALQKINADIVCFQEFFHGEQNYFPTVQPIANSLQTFNIHTDFILSRGKNKYYGLATFSKFPILNKEVIHFEEARSNSGIFTDVLVDSDTFRVFNVHLESIKFSNSDHQYVADFMEPGNHPGNSSGRVIFSKLRNAFIRRAGQAKTIHAYIEASPYPVILCGDFNDTPSSFAYHTVKGKLYDAFLDSGSGFGTTYAEGIPFLRIDYILYSKGLKSFDFHKHLVDFSDHYPVSVYFSRDI